MWNGALAPLSISKLANTLAKFERNRLTEEFLVAERRKRLPHGVWAFEFKVSPKARAKAPARWAETYPDASWEKIGRSNYIKFITT